MAKVLLVDDSLSMRKVIERALESKGLEVLSAASGKEAIEQIGREAPDLVVCDVIMPDMDGYQICEFVRQHSHGGTRVLLISGIVNSAILERAAAAGSSDVMLKPFTADELLSKIESLLPGVQPFAATETTAAAAAEPHATSPAVADAAPARDLKTLLGKLAALPGVSLTILVDRQGFLIESAGEMRLEAEVAGALASCLAESSEGIGRELGRGALQSLILEYEGGLVLLNGVDSTTMLAVVLGDPAVLGKVRYYVKRTLPDLRQAL